MAGQPPTPSHFQLRTSILPMPAARDWERLVGAANPLRPPRPQRLHPGRGRPRRSLQFNPSCGTLVHENRPPDSVLPNCSPFHGGKEKAFGFQRDRSQQRHRHPHGVPTDNRFRKEEERRAALQPAFASPAWPRRGIKTLEDVFDPGRVSPRSLLEELKHFPRERSSRTLKSIPESRLDPDRRCITEVKAIESCVKYRQFYRWKSLPVQPPTG